MNYTDIDVNHHRAHIKQRIYSVEDTHYRHSVSLKLYEMSGIKEDDPAVQEDKNVIKNCEKIHKHLLKLLADLPAEEVKDEDAAP